MLRRVLQLISWLALAGTITPAFLYLLGRITLDQSKWALLAATIVWFIATPLWMGRKDDNAQALPADRREVP